MVIGRHLSRNVLTGATPARVHASLLRTSHAMSRSMATRKTSFILDDRPNLFVGELIAESDHGSPVHPILDHPEHFTFRPVTPKTVMMKVSGARIQGGRKRSIACSVLSVTRHTRSLPLVERFSFGLDLNGNRKWTHQGPRFSELVGGHARLHDVLLRRLRKRQSASG